MKRSTVALLLLSSLVWACQKPPEIVITPVVTPPPVVYYPPVTTPSVKPDAPSGVDLYAQFAQPFISSATQRLKQINIYKDTLLVANSVFAYNNTGQVATVAYLRYFNGTPYRNTVSYAYDDQNRLIHDEESQLVMFSSYRETVTKTTDYSYTGSLLTSTLQKTNAYYVPTTMLSVSNRTSYRYPGSNMTQVKKIGYYNPVGVVNTTEPVDSTRQMTTAAGNITTRVDSLFSARTSILRQAVTTQQERDVKNNALSVRTDTRVFYTNGEQLTTVRHVFTHQYNGPDGLVSSSANQTLGLRYEFIYEPK